MHLLHNNKKGIDRYRKPNPLKGNVVAWRRFNIILALFLILLTLVLLFYGPLFLASLPLDTYG